MNKAILVGNLTRDPESKTTPSGVSCCTFTLAINRRYTNQQTGQREADFLNIVTWRQTADLCARYLTKGRKVGVIGSIQTRTYDGPDGTKRYFTEIVADEVEFIGGQGGSGQGAGDVPPPSEPPARGAPNTAGFDDMDDDELPF